jgi:hypothetical protein
VWFAGFKRSFVEDTCESCGATYGKKLHPGKGVCSKCGGIVLPAGFLSLNPTRLDLPIYSRNLLIAVRRWVRSKMGASNSQLKDLEKIINAHEVRITSSGMYAPSKHVV